MRHGPSSSLRPPCSRRAGAASGCRRPEPARCCGSCAATSTEGRRRGREQGLAHRKGEAAHCGAVPELPEVEIASRQLRAWATGRGSVEQLRKLPALAALGPDPLPGVDTARLYEALRKTRRSLKEALMDQRTLAGLGNIQVSEALHRARLHPQRLGVSLSPDEVARLSSAIGEALRAALEGEDSPEPITYVEEGGENIFLVYDRAGEPCSNCGTSIERIVQGGRSTYFCPHCQPLRARQGVGARAGSGRARLAAARPLDSSGWRRREQGRR